MRKTIVTVAALAGVAFAAPALAGEGGCNWAMKTAQAKAKKAEQFAASQPVQKPAEVARFVVASAPVERFQNVF